VVNKADKDGAEAIRREIETMLSLGTFNKGWRPRVVLTVAAEGKGVSELAKLVDGHFALLKSSGRHQASEAARARHVILQELAESVRARGQAKLDGPLAPLVEEVASRRKDAATAAQELEGRL